MKTKEELSKLKEEYEQLAKKLSELSDEEITQITAGFVIPGEKSKDYEYKIYTGEVEKDKFK